MIKSFAEAIRRKFSRHRRKLYEKERDALMETAIEAALDDGETAS